MEITSLISTLEVQLLPDVAPEQPLLLRLSDPLHPELEGIELSFGPEHSSILEFSELDFPSHFHEGMPLLLEVMTENGEVLHADPNVLVPSEDPLRLEIPVFMPPVDEVEVAAPLVLPESRYLIGRALAEFTEVVEPERVEAWLAEELGEMEMLDALADGVLEGDERAAAHLEELLFSMEGEFEADPGAFETALQEAIYDVEMSGIHNLPAPPSEEFWSGNAFDGTRLAVVLRAAYQAGQVHSEARAMENVARVLHSFQRMLPVQRAYDAAVMAYNGIPRPISAVPEMPGFPRGYVGGPDDGTGPRPPRGPNDGPVPPKGSFTPKVWPPRTVKNPPSPLDEIKKRTFWVIERYFCTFDLLRQLPFDLPEFYSITGISSNGVVCRGEVVTLSGGGFGNSGRLYITQGSNKRELPTNSWTDTLIEFTVPSWAISGSITPQISYGSRNICGFSQPLYKGGSPVYMKVLQLSASLSIERSGKSSTPPGSTAKFFHITQQGVDIRSDKGLVKWLSQDAQNSSLTQTDPNGSVTALGSSFSGSHIFPASGEILLDGTYNFQLDSNNKCGNSNQAVTADVYVGTMAKVTGLTVDGNAGPLAIFSSNNSVPIAWSLADASSFKLEITTVGLNNSFKTVSFSNPSNPLSSWNATNAIVKLVVVGTIRDAANHAALVTDNRLVQVAVEPRVDAFSASRTLISHADTVTFTYRTANATEIRLLRSGKSPQVLKAESGTVTLKMDNPTVTQEVVTLELTNAMLPTGHPNRVISQALTVKYKPSFKKCVLVPQPAVLTQFANGGQSVNQTTPPSKDIKLCYNTSQGNNSRPTPQQFRVVAEVYNAPQPSAYVFTGKSRRNVVPMNMFPPNFFPNINDKFEVKVQVANANGKADCTCKVTYLKGLLNYWFCVRKKSNGGPRYQGFKIAAAGWSKEEAKKKAFAILSARTRQSVSDKTHTATEVAWNGNCL